MSLLLAVLSLALTSAKAEPKTLSYTVYFQGKKAGTVSYSEPSPGAVASS